MERNADTGLAMATQEGHFQDFVLYHVIRIHTLQTFLTAIYVNMSMEDRDPNQMGKIEFYRNEELLCSYRIYQGLLTTSQLLHSEANAF